jgi:hypothetical protein
MYIEMLKRLIVYNEWSNTLDFCKKDKDFGSTINLDSPILKLFYNNPISNFG